MMAGRSTPVVYITANVGSIFEEPTTMLKIWTQEFLSTIARLEPKFVALHCQEVGGKNYEKSMQYVEDFVELLVNSDELRLFDKIRIYLDEDYSSAENFTALGNFYFIHESITDALIYDFEQRRFIEVIGKIVYSKNIEEVGTKEKSKFPLEYFPECKWSRKGFLRTRWCLNGTIFDLVNIHLFHDVSNFIAIKSFPSVYSDTRRRALAYTLERFQTDEFGPVPLFLFGDFNFRTDTQGVVKHLSEGLNSTSEGDDVNRIQFKQEDKVVFSLGKKEFSHSDHQSLFTSKNGDWLLEFDKELKAFFDHLFEFKISFPPSYPFEENSSGDKCYMKTRCPAWCDRVILSHSAIPLVKDSNDMNNVIYSIMGQNTCMGDHKPVYLKFDIKSASATNKFTDLNSSIKIENEDKEKGLIADTNSDEKRDFDKDAHGGIKYSEVEIEKLACSLEALMSQNSSFSRELESNIEPDLSRCTSCRIHQHTGRVINNPGGEEVSKSLVFEDKKIIALLASEIKIPEDLLQRVENQNVNLKEEKQICSWECKSNDDKLERFGPVKRVNSASLVENAPKKEDWKNARCNSDVAWSPCTSIQNQTLAKSWKGSKQFNRGNSRIRLISSSNSLNASLPRLTSHHSSSEEEWFEEIEEGDDDVLRINDVKKETESEILDCPDYCGDKGAVSKSVKPATQSISRTNLFTGEKTSTLGAFEEIPSNANSCFEMNVKTQDHSNSDHYSLTGKSFDRVLRLDETKNRQKNKSSSPQVERDAKYNFKAKPLRIFKRLAEGRKESQSPTHQSCNLVDSTNRESFETLIVDPTVNINETGSVEDKPEEGKNHLVISQSHKFNTQYRDVKQGDNVKVLNMTVTSDSWETIELGGKKSKEKDKSQMQRKVINDYQNENGRKKECVDGNGTNCCCILQ